MVTTWGQWRRRRPDLHVGKFGSDLDLEHGAVCVLEFLRFFVRWNAFGGHSGERGDLHFRQFRRVMDAVRHFGNLGRDGIASSANGMNLVAVDFGSTPSGGLIYTSTDAGANWNPTIAPSQQWVRVACSANGLKIVAAVGYSSAPGYLWISDDGGASWNVQNSSTAQALDGCGLSADGVNLLACASTVDFTGLIYYSTNSGVNWVSTGLQYWTGVASSADGTKLVAVDDANPGHVYVSQAAAKTSTTAGTGGALSGAQAAATELQYIGNSQFMQISHQGTIFAQ